MINFKEKKRLVVIGLGKSATGLGHVTIEIAKQLKLEWDVACILHDADKSFGDLEGIDIAQYSFPLKFDKNINIIAKKIEEMSPCCMLIICQPWKCSYFLLKIKESVKNAKMLIYMPVEGKPFSDIIAKSAAIADLCIVYTSAIYNCIKEKNLNLLAIGHGCRKCASEPITQDERKKIRKDIFSANEILWKKPLIINSNRMYFRKRFDLCIDGFARARTNKNVNLYLHIPGLSRYEGKKIYAKIKELQMDEKIFVNILNKNNSVLSEDRLILLYKACDIGITTAMGEGWGLGSFEHASTGAAQIVPNHIGFQENWGTDNAVFIPCEEPYYLHHEAVYMFPPSVDGIANSIDKLMESPHYLDLMSKKSYQNATGENRSWKFIGQQFSLALKKLINNQSCCYPQSNG